MGAFKLKAIETLSPLEQTVEFVKARLIIIISTDSVGLKSWYITLTGPVTLTEQLSFSHDAIRLKLETEDGQALYGTAFVKNHYFDGLQSYMLLIGSGPLTTGNT